MERSDPPKPVGTPPVVDEDEPKKPSAENGSAADGAPPAAETTQAGAIPPDDPEVDGRSPGDPVPQDAPRLDEPAASPVTPDEPVRAMPAPDAEIDDGVTDVAGHEPNPPIDGNEAAAPVETSPDRQARPSESGDDPAPQLQRFDPPFDMPDVEPLEPWPDPLEMTQPSARRMPRAEASDPPADAHGENPGTGPLPRYQDGSRDDLPELPATYVEVPAGENGASEAERLEASPPGHTFEPSPFAVPPPAAEPSPSISSAPQRPVVGPVLGPVKSRLAAASGRQQLEAPAVRDETPAQPADALPPAPAEPEEAAPSESLPAPPDAAPPAELKIPSAPAADPFARLEPSFGQPRPQDGFLDYRPRPEPSWSSSAAPEPALPTPDLASPGRDAWAIFGSPAAEAAEGHCAPSTFGIPPSQPSEMAAAMGASSSFAPVAGVVSDAGTEPAPGQRDWRDLVRRIAHAAFLVFAGWFIAVLALIVAYRFVNPPFSMLMAQQFLTGTRIQKQWVPLEQISPNLRRAVIVSEDGRFCHHWGIDLIEAANALKRASDGYPRGASTITMQVAKNLFLLPTKSYVRKLIELPLTFAIELAWPKARILEIYLNIVEWGPGIFGAEAASKAHFGRSAASLSPRQAAQLAVALPNPIVRNAGRPGPRTARRASVIQKRAAGARGASSCVDMVR